MRFRIPKPQCLAPVSGVQPAQTSLLNTTSTSGLAASAALLSASSGTAFQPPSALGRTPSGPVPDPSADFSAANFAAGFFNTQSAASLGVGAAPAGGSGSASGAAGMDTYPLTHHLHQTPYVVFRELINARVVRCIPKVCIADMKLPLTEVKKTLN